jgi:hypothetical protein
MIHITQHSKTGKLAGFQSINTNTLTNDFCQKMVQTDTVCKKCYAVTLLKRYKNMALAVQRNSELLSAELAPQDIPHINSVVFRFNSTGELINLINVKNYTAIAEKNQHCFFTLWTKRKDLINAYFDVNKKPKNLSLIYSINKIDSLDIEPPRHFSKTFAVYSKNSGANINCHSKCKDCMLCYSTNNIKNIREIIK